MLVSYLPVSLILSINDETFVGTPRWKRIGDLKIGTFFYGPKSRLRMYRIVRHDFAEKTWLKTMSGTAIPINSRVLVEPALQWPTEIEWILMP